MDKFKKSKFNKDDDKFNKKNNKFDKNKKFGKTKWPGGRGANPKYGVKAQGKQMNADKNTKHSNHKSKIKKRK